MLPLVMGESAALTNPKQFSRLFDEYHGLIFRTAYRLTGNAADAEDVLQTIFLRLVRQEAGGGPVKEESYFRRAAVNVSLDLIRARETKRSVPLDDLLLATGGGDEREVQDCLRRAFARLSPRSAEIFALRYLEEFSNGEIAKMLGISQVLVAVTVHRTRRQLQKDIKGYFGGRS